MRTTYRVLPKAAVFPTLAINTFVAEGRKSTSLATIRWVRKDVDLRPRKNFIGWVRVSIQMLLQDVKSTSLCFVND